jgi:hypothetical protein
MVVSSNHASAMVHPRRGVRHEGGVWFGSRDKVPIRVVLHRDNVGGVCECDVVFLYVRIRVRCGGPHSLFCGLPVSASTHALPFRLVTTSIFYHTLLLLLLLCVPSIRSLTLSLIDLGFRVCLHGGRGISPPSR